MASVRPGHYVSRDVPHPVVEPEQAVSSFGLIWPGGPNVVDEGLLAVGREPRLGEGDETQRVRILPGEDLEGAAGLGPADEDPGAGKGRCPDRAGAAVVSEIGLESAVLQVGQLLPEKPPCPGFPFLEAGEMV